jgi:protein-S-isoprenylcysteine O-methyltransferase Ste14
MTYAVVFMTWLTLVLLYLVMGALLIPYENQVAYNQSPRDAGACVANALWWAVPLSWFLCPSVPPIEARLLGVSLFALGAALVIWARRANPFFLPVTREPRWVVYEGPYRFMAHPGFFAFVLMADGSWLILGHWVGAFPLGAYIGFLFAQAQKENRILYSTRRTSA